MSSVVSRVAVAAIALCFASPDGRGQGFEEAIPGEAVFFVGIDDVGNFTESARQSAWGRFLSDPACASVTEAIEQAFNEIEQEAEASSGANPFSLFSMMDGPFAIAVLDVLDPDVTELEADEVPIAMCALIGVGDRGEDFLDTFDTLCEQGVEEGNTVRRTEMEGDVEVFALVPASEQSTPMQLRYCLKEDVFVLMVVSDDIADRGYLGDILAGLDGEVSDSLAANMRFADSVAGYAGDGIRLWFDSGKLISRALELAQAGSDAGSDDIDKIQGLGLTDFDQIALRMTINAEQMSQECRIQATGQGHVLRIARALLVDGTGDVFAMMPDAVASATALNLDLAAAFDATIEMITDLGLIPAEEVEANLDMASNQAGFDIRGDLIGSIGTSFGYFAASVEDEMENLFGTDEDPRNFAVIIALDDAAKVNEIVETGMRDGGLHAVRKRTEFMGHTVFEIPLPIPVTSQPLRYAILDDMLVVSMSSELMHSVLRRVGQNELPNLLDDSGLAGELEQLGDGFSAITFADAGGYIKDLLAMGRQAIAKGEVQMGFETIPFPDLAWMEIELPADSVVDEYFKGLSVSTLRMDADGFETKSVGP